MNGFFKRIGGFLAAVVTTVILGVVLQTQNLLARLEIVGADLGVNISLAERVSMTFYDLHHLGSVYVIFVSIALALSFLLGGFVFHFAKFGRPIIYIAAGAIAILTMLMGMKQAFFDVHFIGGARDGLGISMQMFAGAVGGWVFARVNRLNAKASP